MDLPLTIDNGHGERLTFERIERGPEGDRLIVSNVVAPGAGPPMHVHYLQAESLTVEEGRLGYRIHGEDPRYAAPGETVTFDAGVAHAFWAEGDETLHCTGWVSPPNNIVYFLKAIYASTAENGGGKPNDLDAAYLMHRYRSEFGMLGIPAFVDRAVFPVLRAIGRLTGRYAKYEDAPEPVRSDRAAAKISGSAAV